MLICIAKPEEVEASEIAFKYKNKGLKISYIIPDGYILSQDSCSRLTLSGNVREPAVM